MPNINDRPPLRKRCCKCRVWVGCKCMESWPLAGVQGKWSRLSSYRKFYSWWYGNPACVDLIGGNRIEKDQDRVPPRPVRGKRGEGPVWFSVCGVPLDNWGNGGYDDVLFTYGDCSLSSFGSWSTHSKFPALFCLRI